MRTETAVRYKVPFLDLRTVHRALKDDILAAVARTLKRGAFVGRPYVEGFEADFARYIGTRCAVGVGSGTDALRLAYLALGVRPATK